MKAKILIVSLFSVILMTAVVSALWFPVPDMKAKKNGTVEFRHCLKGESIFKTNSMNGVLVSSGKDCYGSKFLLQLNINNNFILPTCGGSNENLVSSGSELVTMDSVQICEETSKSMNYLPKSYFVFGKAYGAYWNEKKGLESLGWSYGGYFVNGNTHNISVFFEGHPVVLDLKIQ